MDQPRLVGGRYELSSLLGRGGMAEVHLGRDVRLGRAVAVKTLRVDLAGDPTFQARFRREAQSAASLNHPAIVAVYDTGEDHLNSTPLPYIVMEYVEGTTLRELLQSGRRLLPERALEITGGVLTALEYSHRNGIVHRDIKPGNVMLTRNGHVKVMDFGIARAVADVGATMTATAAVIGTAQYLSPEQAKGEHVDARSDLYSTGCLLYELLTGRPPFMGDSPVSVAYQHVREDPPPPSHFDPEISADIDAIVLKALAKNPDNRYQTADEMRADIDRALDGQPVAAPAVMAGGMLPVPRPGASPTQVIQPTAVIPRGPGGPEGPGGPGGPYGGPPRRYQPPRKQNKAGTYALVTLAVIAVFAIAALFGNMIFGDDGGGRVQEVPSVIGLPEADAARTITNAGFTPAVDPNCAAFDAVQPAGNVIRQTPEPSTNTAPGSTVTLCLSKGQDVVAIPDVTTLSPEEAKAQLEGLGFVVIVTEQASADVDEGNVIGTNPPAGQEAPRGSEVTLFVSTGPTPVEVPDVRGQHVDQARSTLEGAGLRVQVNEVEYADAQAGTVLEQNPGPGATVDPGTTVTLTVAKQPQQPQEGPVPDVSSQKNLTEDQARQILNSAGFNNIDVREQDVTEQAQDGKVVDQAPTAGEVQPFGTKITIWLGKLGG